LKIPKFFDKLKNIFEGRFENILSNNEINISLFNFTRNSQDTLEVEGGNKLNLDLKRATAEERRLIKENIIDGVVQDDKDAFLKDNSSEKTKQIKNNLPKENDMELLNFYKDKLRPDMYKSLEASLVVRNSFKNKEDISELKKDIARRYPQFGNNICNLVSRGYFDSHFKDLYFSMLEDEEFDMRFYQRKVVKIVKSLPYTVFITRYKSFDELSGEVRFKLEKLKKYGTGKLLLHGLGRENVTTTLSILDEYEEEDHIQIEKEINSNKTIITATLIF
jgi:hypothetical protein